MFFGTTGGNVGGGVIRSLSSSAALPLSLSLRPLYSVCCAGRGLSRRAGAARRVAGEGGVFGRMESGCDRSWPDERAFKMESFVLARASPPASERLRRA